MSWVGAAGVHAEVMDIDAAVRTGRNRTGRRRMKRGRMERTVRGTRTKAGCRWVASRRSGRRRLHADAAHGGTNRGRNAPGVDGSGMATRVVAQVESVDPVSLLLVSLCVKVLLLIELLLDQGERKGNKGSQGGVRGRRSLR